MTGGNSGTGYATCKALYDFGATVYLACRSETKGREAIEAIRRGGVIGIEGMEFPSDGSKDFREDGSRVMGDEDCPEGVCGNGVKIGKGRRKGKGRLEFMEIDLADLRSVERFVDDFKR